LQLFESRICSFKRDKLEFELLLSSDTKITLISSTQFDVPFKDKPNVFEAESQAARDEWVSAIRATIGDNLSGVFGGTLNTGTRHSEFVIPSLVRQCCSFLVQHGAFC
jgi:hypothetical protein